MVFSEICVIDIQANDFQGTVFFLLPDGCFS